LVGQTPDGEDMMDMNEPDGLPWHSSLPDHYILNLSLVGVMFLFGNSWAGYVVHLSVNKCIIN